MVKKYLKKVLILTMLLVMCLGALSACASNYSEEDFELVISVEEATMPYGENFVVEVSLFNNSNRNLRIRSRSSPFAPHIDNWNYLHVLADRETIFGLGPPRAKVFKIKKGEAFNETWHLGATGYTEPSATEWSGGLPLPPDTHELRFYVTLPNRQGDKIWSNTIILTVV